MVNLAQGHKSVSSGIVQFLKSILARFVLKVADPDEAAAALAKDVERKARDAARAKARRDARKLRRVEPAQLLSESADSHFESADSPKESADSHFESADSSETPKKCTFPSLAVRPQRRLSLLKNLDPLKESESARRIALPHDWGPNLKVREFAIKRLGDQAAADLCFEKFRTRHETSGEKWTPREWQSRARGWVLLEEQFFGRQRSLPLPPVAVPKAMPPMPGVVIRRFSPQAEAWEKHNGKPFNWGIRSQAFVPTEWPPDHDETRQAS